MTPLYIIPARGGSKGIPRKNIKSLGGQPLISYTIAAAAEARKVLGGYVLLSTDDTEIADVAAEYGLTTEYRRPVELGTDTTSSRDVILDAMDWADEHHIGYDCVILLQPTSPLRKAEDIISAVGLFTGGVDMVVSVCVSSANPYYNLFEADNNGILHVCKGSGLYTRRQDAPEVLEYNGAVYVINPDSIRKMELGAFPVRKPYVMSPERSIDLDTMSDWQVAEQIFRKNE